MVSPSSGQVFDRRLIEKYVQENGIDPVSLKPLSVEDLIDIKVSPLVKPKPPSATSIPAILKSLQDEWDAVSGFKCCNFFRDCCFDLTTNGAKR